MDAKTQHKLLSIVHQPHKYAKILETTKGKGIGLTREGSLYKLGWSDGGKTIPEFDRHFLSPLQAYTHAEKVVKKLDEEGRGKRVKKVKSEGKEKKKSFVPSD